MNIELLSPAGTLKNMRYAFAYGADAVYAGQPRYSLRVRNNDFSNENLRTGIQEAHSLNKKFYLASNLLPHNSKVRTYLADMQPIMERPPDALIMSDPGLIMLVRERWPEAVIHLSVQANTMNYASVKFWYRQGISRVILSRELSLDEIEEIRQQCPEIELEVFVHGALCIAYSGRCLLSGYMNHRDPNQGTCTNACRWSYRIHQAVEDEIGDIKKITDGICQTEQTTLDTAYLLEEENRPSEFMPIFEDEHGTYIMNSKDLRAVQHVERLIDIGVNSLKIEGRTKSHFYVARTAQVYRQAIDNVAKNKFFDKNLMVALDSLANRGYTEGFYRRHVPQEYQNYHQGSSISTHQQFVGEIIGVDASQERCHIEVKNKFSVGDTLEWMTPDRSEKLRLKYMEDLKGNSIEVAPGSGYTVQIPMPDFDVNMGLIMKYL